MLEKFFTKISLLPEKSPENGRSAENATVENSRKNMNCYNIVMFRFSTPPVLPANAAVPSLYEMPKGDDMAAFCWYNRSYYQCVGARSTPCLLG